MGMEGAAVRVAGVEVKVKVEVEEVEEVGRGCVGCVGGVGDGDAASDCAASACAESACAESDCGDIHSTHITTGSHILRCWTV